MKKLAFAIVAISLAFTSCKQEKKKDSDATKAEESVVETTNTYVLVQDSVKVAFTAYKTTEKLPVGGTFTQINLKNSVSGLSPIQALDGQSFGIPVSSLFTNDATGTRDPKIKEFFFGVMKNTEVISGTFKLSGEKLSMDLTLNGETHNVPMVFDQLDDTHFKVSGVLEMANWNAMGAITSINKACEALHTGPDGVSKTWSDVAVNADLIITTK